MLVKSADLNGEDKRTLIRAEIDTGKEEISLTDIKHKATVINFEIRRLCLKSYQNQLLLKLGKGEISQKWQLAQDLTQLAKKMELMKGPVPVDLSDIEEKILTLAGFEFNDGIEITEETIRNKEVQIAASVNRLFQSHFAYKFTYLMGWGQITSKLNLAYDLRIVADNIKTREELKNAEAAAVRTGDNFPLQEDYIIKTEPKFFKGTYR